MSFKVSPQLSGAERTRAWHHHVSHTPTSPRPFYPITPNKSVGSVPQQYINHRIIIHPFRFYLVKVIAQKTQF